VRDAFSGINSRKTNATKGQHSVKIRFIVERLKLGAFSTPNSLTYEPGMYRQCFEKKGDGNEFLSGTASPKAEEFKQNTSCIFMHICYS